MNKTALVLMVCILAVMFSVAWCEEGRKSTEQERKDFLKGVKEHEDDPTSKKSAAFRNSALRWMLEIEDITVSVTFNGVWVVFTEGIGEGYDYRTALFGQFLIANCAYAIENMGKEDDPVQRNVQALESCLRAYRSIIKGHPERKNAAMDKLEKLAASKKLAEYVKEKLRTEEQEDKGRKSTEQERKDFLKDVKAHEDDPTSKKSAAFRRPAVRWMIENITLTLNGGVFAAFSEGIGEDYDYSAALVGQFFIANGAYAIENMGKEDDPVQRNVQALESCLRAYRNIIKGHPERKNAAMDELERLATAKKLQEYVKEKLGTEEQEDEDAV